MVIFPGAINISVQELNGKLNKIPKDKPVVVYCRSGSRSSQAARTLLGAGYTDVYDLGGPFWVGTPGRQNQALALSHQDSETWQRQPSQEGRRCFFVVAAVPTRGVCAWWWTAVLLLFCAGMSAR